MQEHLSTYTRAGKSSPCPICGKMARCSRTDDGLYFCWEARADAMNFRHLGAAKGDPRFHLFRLATDPLFRSNGTGGAAAPQEEGRGKEIHEKPARSDLLGRAQEYARASTPGSILAFSEHLGLPVEAMEALHLLGVWQDTRYGRCWSWPALDGQGNVVGIWRRSATVTKRLGQGHSGGLIPNRLWEEMEGPVFITEGTSSVCALHALGLASIGVHTAGFGAEMLAEMLGSVRAERSIIVLADRDEKPNGDRPGLDGARKLTCELAGLLKRDLHWSYPPDHAKDSREWVQAIYRDGRTPVDWSAARLTFLDGLALQSVIHQPISEAETDHTGLDTEPFSSVVPKAVDFLIPGYFARGKMHILAGPGGVGKSRWTYEFAARISRGQPWGGMTHGVPHPMPVLLANCEDGHEDTIAPCLHAAGADLDLVRRLKAAVAKDGSSLRFSLNNLPAIEGHFRRVDKPGWLIVDPVGSFTGGGGFDAFREADVKSLLDPLSDVLRQYGWTALLVMHLNKGTGRKAIDRLMNSVAFGNTARGVFGIYESPDDEDGRDFLPMKFNMGRCPRGRSYVIRDLYSHEQDRVGDALAGKLDPGEWALLAPQLSCLDCWTETDRTAEDANADDDAQAETLPDDVRQAEKILRAYLEGAPQLPRDCQAHVSDRLGKNVQLKWLRTRVFYARLKGTLTRIPGTPPVVMWCLPGQSL